MPAWGTSDTAGQNLQDSACSLTRHAGEDEGLLHIRHCATAAANKAIVELAANVQHAMTLPAMQISTTQSFPSQEQAVVCGHQLW